MERFVRKEINRDAARGIWRTVAAAIFFLLIAPSLSACSLSGHPAGEKEDTEISAQLTCVGIQENDYAKEFSIAQYEDGYALISITDGSRFLVVPEGREAPSDLAADIEVIRQPVIDIYLAASAVMDMFCAMDATDCIALSGLEADSWHIPKAREAMEQGKILYAGKYSAPDYELITSSGSPLSIQSTMAEHVPEVKEQLKLLGVSVLVDRSSYEEHPLGRMEWIKVYGVITGRMEQAQEAYERQKRAFEKGCSEESLDKTVAFFNVTSTGAVNIRKPQDYIAKMIKMAGGTYVFADMPGAEGATGTMNLQMEEFYAKAKDADFLIYNSTIAGEIYSLEELLERSPLFADFKAVQQGNVWCITADFYQSSMELGTATEDIHKMLLTEETEDDTFTFLFRLK